MTKGELQHDPLPGAAEKQVLRRRHGRVTETRDMVAAEVPVAFACNGEPFSVMMATPDDLEDFAFGFALAEGIVASADEVVIDSIETSLDGVAIALSIPSDRPSVLEARRRSIKGRRGRGLPATSQVEAGLRPPPPGGTGTV